MDRVTQLALNAINQRFYAGIVREWIDTRKHPWPGFQRILDFAQRVQTGAQPPLRVLDVGCGDGRFGAFIKERYPADAVHYVGCDASPALLEHARARHLGEHYHFAETDFVSMTPSAAWAECAPGPFDLICVLGVLHHVPGRIPRQQLVRALAERLSPHGILALTLWRLTDDPRFASRVVPFADYNRSVSEPNELIALDQLEPGDTLLRWGSAGGPPRYCHFPDARESQQLMTASTLRILEHFHADGRGDRLNEYVLLGH